MHSLLTRLGLFRRTDSGAAKIERTTSLGEDADNSEVIALQNRLDRLLAKRRERIDDLVYRIDFGGMSERLGSAWNDSRHYAKIKSTIEAAIGPNDIYVRYDSSSFLVIFPLLGRREGQLKAAKLCQDIESKLFGSELPPRLISLQQASLDSAGRVSFVGCPDLGSLVADLVRQSELEADPELDEQAKTATPGRGESNSTCNVAGVAYVYRPLVALQSRIVSGFITIPTREASSRHFESGYQVLDNPRDPLEIFSLDRLSLTNTLNELDYLIKQGGKSLFVISVHYETLAHNRRSRDYIRFASERIAGKEKRVIFELVDLPTKVPQTRLVELVSVVAPISRAVIARFPSDANVLDYRVTGLHAIGIDIYQSAKRERKLMEEMDSFVEAARKSGLRSYVQGVRSLSLLLAAITSGFDYVAGHSLGPACHRAEDVRRFELDEIFRSIIDSYASLDRADAADGDIIQ